MKNTTLLFVAVPALVVAFAVSLANGQEKSAAAPSASSSATSEVVLPPWLPRLNLSAQQDQQVRAIYRDYNTKVAAVWQTFTECYQQTTKIEAVLLTAIEDNLTDAQRQQVRDMRRKTAQGDSPTSSATNAPISLTADQEAAADKINAKYISRLRSLNRDITVLHNRLVALEADKIVEIEKLLTKPQLETLSQIRQEAPLPPEPSVGGSTAPKNK
jgi:Spy/CpxP family protein refolding chaperone